MTLANGRQYLAIPGPSVVPDRVLQAMHRAAPNIYDLELAEMVEGLVPDLKAIARTKHQAAMYIANGHGIWEAAISNTLNAGDEVLVIATGRFAFGWALMAERMGIKVHILDFGKSSPLDADTVAEFLAADTGHKIRAVLAVHTDTATSVQNDIPELRQLMDGVGHPALLMVDCMASLGCDRFEMDEWGADLAVAGCQKGLMTPPGMAFIFFNEKADEWRERCVRTSHYWDWRPRVKPKIFSEYFDGTAPTHHLYGLREALDMMKEEGIDNVWARHETLARAIWAACEAWGAGGPLQLNVSDPAHRSHAVTALSIGAPFGRDLRRWCETQAGVTLGIGLGMETPDDPKSEGFFRIGHMGHVNAPMVMGMLGTVQAGLSALGIPHGTGGLNVAAAVIAAPIVA